MKNELLTIQISRGHLAAFAAIAVVATGGMMVARAYTPGQTSNGLPLVIPYQGTLSRDGQPFNGNQSMTFALHDSATGGVPLWTSNLRNVDVVGGKFAVTLGDSNDTNEQLTPADFQQNALYVSVNIDGAELLPRQRFAPAPQAITAATAKSASGDLALEINAITQNASALATRVQTNEDTIIKANGADRISMLGTFCGHTPNVTGEITYTQGATTLYGVQAAKKHCESACASPRAHMCTSHEIFMGAQIGIVPAQQTSWVISGGVDSSPNDQSINFDCAGYTQTTSALTGGTPLRGSTLYKGENQGGGPSSYFITSSVCTSSKPISCCL